MTPARIALTMTLYLLQTALWTLATTKLIADLLARAPATGSELLNLMILVPGWAYAGAAAVATAALFRCGK